MKDQEKTELSVAGRRCVTCLDKIELEALRQHRLEARHLIQGRRQPAALFRRQRCGAHAGIGLAAAPGLQAGPQPQRHEQVKAVDQCAAPVCRQMVGGHQGSDAFGRVRGRYLVRQRQRRRVAALRAQLAIDLHDEVGTLLTRVSVQAELLQSLPPAQQPPAVAGLLRNSRAAASTLRDVVWGIDARADSAGSLLDHTP